MKYNARKWWIKSGQGVHKNIRDAIEDIWAEYTDRTEMHIHHHRMYSNREAEGLFGRSFLQVRPQRYLSMNIIKEIVDTLVAHYGLQQIWPMALTEEGNWKLQQQGRKINTFTKGQFRANKIYRLGPQCIQDGGVHGLGALYTYARFGKIYTERVFPPQLLFDEEEAMNLDPRYMFRIYDVARDRLLERSDLSKHRDIIRRAGRLDSEHYYIDAEANNSDMITVIEAWRLQPEDGLGHGRYACVLTSGTLFDVPYDRQCFPFSFFRYPGSEGQGIWPSSVVDNQQPRQVEINLLLQKLQRQWRSTSMKIFIEANNKVIKEHLNNEDATIIQYTGQPPITAMLGAVSPELTNQMLQLRADAFESEGVNKLASHGELPAGIKSGKGQQIYIDEGTKRLRYMGRSVEWMYIDLARNMIDTAKEIDESGNGTFEIMAEDRGTLKKIKWSDINISADKYQIAIQPTNFFSQSISAKFEQANEMLDRSIIGPDEWSAMMDFPDLQSVTSRRNAPYREIETAIDMMMNEKQALPDAFTNHALAGPMVQSAYLQAKNDNAPEEILELFRNYLLALQNKIAEIQAQQQPPAPPEGQAPPEGEMPPEAAMMMQP